MLNLKVVFITICVFCFCQISTIAGQSASKPNDDVHPSVRVKARAQNGRVLLRWAVDHPLLWKEANKAGFVVERYRQIKDKKPKLVFEKYLLSPTPIKAQPLEKWMKIVEKDDNAAIIAQALYGKDFSTGQKLGFGEMMSRTQEEEMRYSFAMLSADMSFEAACIAGWGFVDSTALPNEEYFYKVFVSPKNLRTKIDTGITSISEKDYTELPSPIQFTGQFNNKIAKITWDNKWQANVFTAYVLERSEDSINFKSVTSKPIININNPDEPLPSFSYNDTLPQKDKRFYYRLKGITCFGEYSPPTQIISGISRDELSFSPNIEKIKVLNDSTAVVNWTMTQDSTLAFLKEFDVSVANEADGEYKTIVSGINKNSRNATCVVPLSSTYFIVSAIDKNGQRYRSFPQLVQTIDSTPPSPPLGLEGFIDSNGVVQLKWQPNTEKDIFGYYVFKSNLQGEEMSLMTGDPLIVNQHSDTIGNKLLNEKVYYAVAALDQRYNQSGYSTIIEVKRPDKNPPVAPVFKDYKLEFDKVSLYWDSSPNEDVKSQRIYKKIAAESKDDTWELLKEFTSIDSTSYIDNKVKSGTTVAYVMMAVDKDNNESPPSTPLTLTIPFDKKDKVAIKELSAAVDRQSKKILIEWVYAEKGVVEYQIFRTMGKEKITLWKVADKSTVAIVDDEVSPSNIYRYAVRAVFNDGVMSQWKEISVKF
jgi:uncharacterized protein